MRTKITSLPILLDRKASIYTGVGDGDTDIFFGCIPDDNVLLTSDGSNVEFSNSTFVDFRRLPFTELQITLDITVEEFMELTQGEDTFVDIILTNDKIRVTITTHHTVIYDKEHTIR